MSKNIIKDLGNGLILRRATAADTEALVEFNGRIHADPDSDGPEEYVATWVQDLMEKSHPTFNPADFTIVEDTATGKIVSSLNLINQTWSYAGVEFGVGRPELVGTDPEYRRRGLVRAQFDVIHQWSAERGHKLQGITGIPYYYRQFEYEMGLALGGGRIAYRPNIPKLKDGESEPYQLRFATEADIPFLMEMYAQKQQRELLSAVWDANLWRYELSVKSEKHVNRRVIRIIESEAGQPVGMLAHVFMIWGQALHVSEYQLAPGVSWLAVSPSVMRALKEIGESYAQENKKNNFEAISFQFGAEHPFYEAMQDHLPRVRDPYAWYIRIPNLADFLTHIGPVLEKRLADSVLVGHTGELKLNFYTRGVKLSFDQGQLNDVSSYQPEHPNDGDVQFPDLTFTRVLCGYNDFWELEKLFADCYARNDQGRALVPILFPKQASNVWPIS